VVYDHGGGDGLDDAGGEADAVLGGSAVAVSPVVSAEFEELAEDKRFNISERREDGSSRRLSFSSRYVPRHRQSPLGKISLIAAQPIAQIWA